MKRLDDEKGNTSVNEDMNRCEEGRDDGPQIERTAKSDQGRTILNQVQTTMQMSETVCEGEQVFGKKRARGKDGGEGRRGNTHNTSSTVKRTVSYVPSHPRPP